MGGEGEGALIKEWALNRINTSIENTSKKVQTLDSKIKTCLYLLIFFRVRCIAKDIKIYQNIKI